MFTVLIFGQTPIKDDSQFVTKNLKVEGNVIEKMVFDLEKIMQLPQFHSNKQSVVCMSGDIKSHPMTYTGVLLKDILDVAKIKIDDKRDMNEMYVIIQASDGYKALFSYHEIYNTPNGEKIVLYYKKEDQLLGSEEGDFALISLNDTKNGPRHVKWVDKIIVKSDR
jgi:hypothetical protein